MPSHAGIPLCFQLETFLYVSNYKKEKKKKIPHVMKNSARELQHLDSGLDFITVMKLHKHRLSLPACCAASRSLRCSSAPSPLAPQPGWGRQGSRRDTLGSLPALAFLGWDPRGCIIGMRRLAGLHQC